MICAKNLYKEFYLNGSKKVVVLKDVNLIIPTHKITLIWGPSGAGKTTLLHILGTLLKPSYGEVFWNGVNIYNLNDKELSKFRSEKIGFIFQFFHLIPDLTLEENVFLPLLIKKQSLKKNKEKVYYLLNSLGIFERRKHYPSDLSGGESQRACIARALVGDPEYIFCDEPTGSLDSENAKSILEILIKLNKEFKKTLIVVSHQKILEEFADLVYYLYDGKIIESKGG